jgi:hypothetical protein
MGKKWEYNETVGHLFTHFKKAYDSVRREVLYGILIEFRLSMKLVTLIKMCLNKMYIIQSKYVNICLKIFPSKMV